MKPPSAVALHKAFRWEESRSEQFCIAGGERINESSNEESDRWMSGEGAHGLHEQFWSFYE